jgi:hypothetical protein
MTRTDRQRQEKEYGRKSRRLLQMREQTKALEDEVDALYADLYLYTEFDEKGDPILEEEEDEHEIEDFHDGQDAFDTMIDKRSLRGPRPKKEDA